MGSIWATLGMVWATYGQHFSPDFRGPLHPIPWSHTGIQWVNYFEPYTIDPVDTTGGGDSFRAGIVYGFLKGWDENRMIQFAAAVAAINCTRFPGVMNTPTIDEVSAFMSESDQ